MKKLQFSQKIAMAPVFALLAGIVAIQPASAQEAAERPAPCAGGEFQRFGFWPGQWNVFNTATGELSGSNTVRSIHNGCAMIEEWSGTDGVNGTAMVSFNARTNQWSYHWASDGNGGYWVDLTGGPGEGRTIVMEGNGYFYQAERTIQIRVTWSQDDSGEITQRFDGFDDDTSEWTHWFTGRYEARGAEE